MDVEVGVGVDVDVDVDVGVDVGVDVVVCWASAAELTGSIAALEMIRGVAPLKMNEETIL